MRLVCNLAVLNDCGSHRPLDGLLHHVGMGWHVLIADLGAIRDTAWYRELGRRDQELVDQSVITWAYQERRPRQGPHRLEIVVTPVGGQTDDFGDDRWSLPADTAEQVASQPVRVFVENALSDGVFVGLAIKRLHGGRLDGTPDSAWAIVNGGGIFTLKRLILRAADAQRTAGHPLRLVAIFDSDRRHPADAEGGAAYSTECETALTNAGIPCLRLRARTLENCIPNRALMAWASSRRGSTSRQAQALAELTGDARDHFPADTGFATVNRWPQAAQTLLVGATTQQQRRLLAQGVDGIKRTDPGTQVPELLDEAHWQRVTAADLRRRLGADADSLLELFLRFL